MQNRFRSSYETADFSQRPAPAAQRRSTSLTDLFGEYNRLNLLLMERVNQVVMDTLEPAVSRVQNRPSAATRPHADCADPCQHDSCHCTCCINDADLVVYARLGERRVVPIIIENERHRERNITLDLSDWTSHGGKKTGIKAALSEKAFSLPACSQKEVILLIDANQFEQVPAGTTDAAANADRTRGNDVDDCTVVYADLRVEGCDIRPLRLALAFLPRDCAPFEIHCSCSCCHD